MGIRCADHVTPLYPQKLALTSPTSGGRSVGIVRLRTKATELVYYYYYYILPSHLPILLIACGSLEAVIGSALWSNLAHIYWLPAVKMSGFGSHYTPQYVTDT